jgi:hypothetical protein
MSVSLVKVIGRHAALEMAEVSPVVYVTPMGNVIRNTAGLKEFIGRADVVGGDARHLCSAFDLETMHCESRCVTDVVTSDCDCTVRLTGGSWVRGDASMVA